MEKICSKDNRSIIMGMSIIAITICHITQFVGIYKGLSSGICNQFLYDSAAVGVDFFFFFSLVGLGYSFEKNKLMTFYQRRVRRIFPAYIAFLLITIFWFYSEWGFHEQSLLFIEQISGFSATKHVNERIEWYVPSLILLYALYPISFKIVKLLHKNRICELVTIAILVFFSFPFSALFNGLFAMRLPLYYLAILTYFYLKEERTEKLIEPFLIAITFSFFVKNTILSYALIVPLFLFVLNVVIDKLSASKIGSTFRFVGHYTLEIYLAQVLATKYIIKIIPSNNIILIVLAVFATTALFSFFLNFIQKVTNYIVEYLSSQPLGKENKRKTWIDAAKGLSMLIIMWGHVQSPSPLKMWLTSFHVPLFLVLTGILLTNKGTVGGGGKNLLNKLLRPYLTFSVLAIVVHFVYALVFHGAEDGINSLGINLYKTITGYGILAIWFIPSYFIAVYLFVKNYNKSLLCHFFLLTLWVVVGMAGSLLFDKMRDCINSQTIYDAIYYPTCALLRGMACSYYVVLGSILYKIFKKTYQTRGFVIILLLVGVICLCLNLYLSQYLGGTNFSMLKLGSQPYMNYLCGTLGSIWIIILFYSLRRVIKFPGLQYIGRKSLIIMGTHMSLLLTSIIPALVGHFLWKPDKATADYYIFGVLCVIIMIILEIPIIRVFEGKLNFLISRKKHN